MSFETSHVVPEAFHCQSWPRSSTTTLGCSRRRRTGTDLEEEAKKFHDDPTTQPPSVDDESTVETLPMAYMNTSSVKCLIKLSRRAKPYRTSISLFIILLQVFPPPVLYSKLQLVLHSKPKL